MHLCAQLDLGEHGYADIPLNMRASIQLFNIICLHPSIQWSTHISVSIYVRVNSWKVLLETFSPLGTKSKQKSIEIWPNSRNLYRFFWVSNHIHQLRTRIEVVTSTGDETVGFLNFSQNHGRPHLFYSINEVQVFISFILRRFHLLQK